MLIMNNLKKILAITTFATIVITGCSKDDNNNTPDPVVPPTNKELLTAKIWQLGETTQVLSGSRIHYVKGGENTSGVSMEKLRIKFNADGTGTTTDVGDITYNLTWAFSSGDESTIHITVNGNIIIDWYFVDIEADGILQSTNISTNSLSTAKWIPVP